MKTEREMFLVLFVGIILGLIANKLLSAHLNFILVLLITAGLAYLFRLLRNLYKYWINKNK